MQGQLCKFSKVKFKLSLIFRNSLSKEDKSYPSYLKRANVFPLNRTTVFIAPEKKND